jgi:hypothetical protein
MLAARVGGDRDSRVRPVGGSAPVDLIEHTAMAALLVVWAVPLTRATGGRGVHNQLLFVAVLIPVLLAVRIWRAPRASLVWSASVAIAALAVCVLTPTGWSGSDAASGYVASAAVFVIARRYVRDDERRSVVAAAVCLAGIYEFLLSFRVWWERGDPAAVMSGTFYWHNPFAAFLLPGAVIGLALIAAGRSPWHLVGWVSVPLCTAGIVISSSRATQAVLAVAFVIVPLASRRDRSALRRSLAGVAVAAGFTALLPGPPWFSHYASPFASTTARSATGQSLSQNGYFRTEFWREALAVFTRHPLVGDGYHSLASATVRYEPAAWAQSQFAHDGYLQALTDGGLLLAVPFLAAIAVIAWWALRRFGGLVAARRGVTPDLLMVGIATALLGALAHSAVDFDWSHPSIMIEGALLAACVAPAAGGRAHSRRTTLVAAPAAVVLGLALVVSVLSLHYWQRDQTQLLPRHPLSTASLLSRSDGTFGDYRPAALLLREVSSGQRTMSRAQAAEALRLTATEASLDVSLALLRDDVSARYALDPDAAGRAQALVNAVSGGGSTFAAALAEVYADSGRPATAQALLQRDIAAQVRAGSASADLAPELTLWARVFGPGAAYDCQLVAVENLALAPRPPAVPAPSAQCLSRRDQEASATGRSDR